MTDKDKSLNIPNLHPDHRGLSSPEGSPSQTNGYLQDPDAQLSQSFKDRIETFVGSYSRTSMMHMAENVMVSEGGMVSFFFFYIDRKSNI
jgi:vesicular inhibitory amino acid transporter